VGRPKAEAAAAALAAIAPGTRCLPRTAGLLSGVGLAELRDADLVVSALDSVAARVRLAARCNLVGASLLDGGTHPWGGEVRYYPAGGGECFGCGLDADRRSVQDDPWCCGVGVPAHRVGASAPVSALVASWLAVTTLRIVLGLPVRPGVVRVEPGTPWAGPVAVRQDRTCPLHDSVAGVTRVGLSADSAVGDLLALLEPGESILTWASVTGDESPAQASYLLADVPAARSLRSAGIAPRELLPVLKGTGPVSIRYLELAESTEGDRR
jgi:hypothetical protein